MSSTLTNISTFDIFTNVKPWFTDWSTALETLTEGLQLASDATDLKISGIKSIKMTGTGATAKYSLNYGTISFLGIDLIVKNMVLNGKKQTLKLTAEPVMSSASWSLSEAIPTIAPFSMLDDLIQQPSFTWNLSVNNTGGNNVPATVLSFSADVATSGYGLGQEANEFLSFFGKSGSAQQFLQSFGGGIVQDKINIQGSIDFANPIATNYSGNVPNVKLKAALTGGTDSFTLFNFLTVKNPSLAFTTVAGPVTQKPTQAVPIPLPDFAGIEPTFKTELIIDKNAAEPVIVSFSAGAPPAFGAMTFKLESAEAGSITLPQIFSLMNGSSWEGLIPAPLQEAMNDVGFQSFSANVSLPESGDEDSKFALNWITCEVTSNFTNPVDLPLSLSLSEIGFTCVWTIFNPTDKEKMYGKVDFHGHTTLTVASTTTDLTVGITDNHL